jgi:hypothetical protein
VQLCEGLVRLHLVPVLGKLAMADIKEGTAHEPVAEREQLSIPGEMIRSTHHAVLVPICRTAPAAR